MKLSNYFLPTLKENPINAKIPSHQLMIRSGMISQINSGIYSWLPIGLKVLNKISNIIRDKIDESGGQEVLMPTIQPKELWQESGRYDDYGKEMLRIKDRHDRDMLYGPTHEEIVTDIFRKNINSYKNLPKNLYQIQWKFRDEIRPRFGVMRGREFLMKDGYSFDIDYESAKLSYNLMYETYFKIFKKIGLNAIALKADTGAIGGNLSHEFHVLTDNGESKIYYDKKFEDLVKKDQLDVEAMKSLYAMADDMHDEEKCKLTPEDLASKRGIEVGHIFYFGDKYSKAMNAKITGKDGKGIYPQMGSYGIGVSRLVAAAIEANHDKNGIIWPPSIAPFQVIIVNVKSGDEKSDKICENLYQDMLKNNIEVIYDDRKIGMGQKLANADLIGIPKQIIIGPNSIKDNSAQICDRRTGVKINHKLEDVLGIFC